MKRPRFPLFAALSCCIAFAFLLLPPLAGAEQAAEPVEAFLARVRRAQGLSTYAMLEGTVQHRRRGSDTEEYTIYFGVILQPERVTGQLVIGGDEGYLVGQSRTDGSGSTVPMGKSTARLDRCGIRASDLSMGFLYGKFLRELPRETVSGVVTCRVIELECPVDGAGAKVRIHIAEEAGFPLRAAFFRAGEEKPFRSLEISSFARKEELYYAKALRLEGPGWRTLVTFDPVRARLGLYDPAKPPEVIRQLR